MILFSLEGLLFLLRWIHMMAGIVLLGLLYYFNFVQTPSFSRWFRWGATLTFLSGWAIVFTHLLTGTATMTYYALTLTGGTLATLMSFNALFVIQANSETPRRAAIASRALRTTTLFSIPMLFFMSSARNLSIARSEDPSYVPYLVIVLVAALLFEANIFAGTATTQRPLATVAGTIQAGLGLTLVLFVAASALL